MSWRTLVELNHDECPQPGEFAEYGTRIADYIRSGDKKKLPRGVTFKHCRHHSDPDPMAGQGDPS